LIKPAAVRAFISALDPSLTMPLTTMSIDQLLGEGRKSVHKRTVALAEKVIEQVDDLRNRLAAEQQAERDRAELDNARAKAREEVDALEAKLAKARSKLKGMTHTPELGVPVPRKRTRDHLEPEPCPDCGESFAGAAGVAAHRVSKHGWGGFAPTPCPDCGQVFDTPQGLGAHRAHKHGYRRPK
jgi:hypothetical protein